MPRRKMREPCDGRPRLRSRSEVGCGNPKPGCLKQALFAAAATGSRCLLANTTHRSESPSHTERSNPKCGSLPSPLRESRGAPACQAGAWVRASGAAINIVWKVPPYDFAESRGTQTAHLCTLSGLSALDLKKF